MSCGWIGGTVGSRFGPDECPDLFIDERNGVNGDDTAVVHPCQQSVPGR